MASEIKVNTISEKTSANGVTIDGVNIKDGKIATANSIDSDAYVDGSIDNAHIADDAIDSEHYAAGSIDTAHIADDQITLAKMAAGTDGNIISYDASGNPVAIATGNDGQVLTSAGAGNPPAFEAAAAGGKILQVQSASDTTGNRSHSSDSWSQSSNTLDVNITPAATSSKILIMSNISMKGAGDYSCTYYRGSTNLGNATDGFGRLKEWTHFSGAVIDSPSTTSQVTYKFYFRANDGVITYMNYGASATTGHLIAMEIGA
jgi:hypothetical protein